MGARGPQPTPTAILKARGSWLAPAREKAGEPQVQVAAPSCPVGLKGEARKEWKRVTQEMLVLRTIAKSDRAVLELYCKTYALRDKAERELERVGLYVSTPNGVMQQSVP